MGLLTIGSVLMSLLPGCTGDETLLTRGAGTVCDGDVCVVDVESGGGTTHANTVNLSVTAEQWDFVPDTLEVTEGDHVVITFTNTLTEQTQYLLHSFSMNACDIAADLPAGDTVSVEFDADQVGGSRSIAASSAVTSTTTWWGPSPSRPQRARSSRPSPRWATRRP